MEHRWGTREAIGLPVRISTAGLAGTGVLRNLSVSGAFVETALPLAPLSTVRVQIPRGRERNCGRADAWGFVVRLDASGVGIEWCEAEMRRTAPSEPHRSTRAAQR